MMWKQRLIRLILGLIVVAITVPTVRADEKKPKLKILLVDDDAQVRRLFGIGLGIDHEVVEAVDGQDALNKFYDSAEAGKPFDLVLSDVNMPNMQGDELRRNLPNVFFILHSGRFSELQQKVPADAMTILIEKPSGFDVYKAAIAKFEVYRAAHPVAQAPQPGTDCQGPLGAIGAKNPPQN